MKSVTVEMTLFEDAFDKKSPLLNELEIMFDDHRNEADAFMEFSESIKPGETVRITIERV